MSIIFQATKYKILEYCIDFIGNKISSNFINISDLIFPMELVKTGMYFKLIKRKDNTQWFKNCEIVYASIPSEDFDFEIKFICEESSTKSYKNDILTIFGILDYIFIQ